MRLPEDPPKNAGLAEWANWSVWLSRLDRTDGQVAAACVRADAMLTAKPRQPSLTQNDLQGGRIRKMSRGDAALNRAQEIASLPRIGTSRLNDVASLVHCLEDIAFQVAALREKFHEQGRPEWCAMADTLDDVMDVLDAVRPCTSPPQTAEEPVAGWLHVDIRK